MKAKKTGGENTRAKPGRKLKKYEQVARDLEKRIREGAYSKKLPGIRLLSDDLGSNPMTVGSAIKLLVEKGLLYRIPKSGTYVQEDGRKRSGVVAFVVNDMNMPMTSKLLASMSEVADEKKLKLVLYNYLRNPNREAAIIKELVRDRTADGIIWFPSSIEAVAELKDIFSKGKMPFIGVGIPYAGMEEIVVTADPFDGFRVLTRHLVEVGRKRILFVTDRPRRRISETSPRYLGYRSVLDDNGLEVFRPFVVPDTLGAGVADDVKAGLLKQLRGYDALLCAHDRLAANIHQLLVFGNLRCPEDVALASYDGLEISEALGITTYAQPFDVIGRTAVTNLMRLVSAPGGEIGNELISGNLIVRRSTGG